VSNADNKQARKRAVAQEQQRRWRQAETNAPLTRAELEELIVYLSDRVLEAHDGTFTFTEAWLAGKSLAPEPVLGFLRANHAECDFEVFYADPHLLFGPTPARLARIPIDEIDLASLREAVDDRVRGQGCDHSVRFTRQWLIDNRFPAAPTLSALLAQGGGCDCEVAMNAQPHKFYPRAR